MARKTWVAGLGTTRHVVPSQWRIIPKLAAPYSPPTAQASFTETLSTANNWTVVGLETKDHVPGFEKLVALMLRPAPPLLLNQLFATAMCPVLVTLFRTAPPA